ncbi:hypothetical protein PRIC1_004603 [Phytophthora ramorum]
MRSERFSSENRKSLLTFSCVSSEDTARLAAGDYSRSRRLRRLYQRFVLRKHVQRWQFNVKHAMATRFDEFLLRSKAKKMLAAWKQVAAKHHCWRHLCATFVGEKATQTVRRGFRRWQQLVHERQVSDWRFFMHSRVRCDECGAAGVVW